MVLKKSHCEALSVVDTVESKLNMAVNLTKNMAVNCFIWKIEDQITFKMGCICWSELQLKYK